MKKKYKIDKRLSDISLEYNREEYKTRERLRQAQRKLAFAWIDLLQDSRYKNK